MWGIPLCCNLLSKRIDQKNFLLWQQLTELHQLFDGVYNIVLLRILRYSGKVSTREENKQQGNCKAVCFTSKCKKLTHICLQVSATKANITLFFSIIKIHVYVYLIPSYPTLYSSSVSLVTNLLFAYPLKYCLLQYEAPK